MFSRNETPPGDFIASECLQVLLTLANEAFLEHRKADCERYIDQVYALLDD